MLKRRKRRAPDAKDASARGGFPAPSAIRTLKRADVRARRTGARRSRRFSVGQASASDIVKVFWTTHVEAA